MKKDLKTIADARLSALRVDEGLKHRILSGLDPREEPIMKKRVSLSMALVLTLILATVTAFALTNGFGLFDLMNKDKDPGFGAVQPEAHDLVNKDVATADFEHVEVTVTEAVYDGRYLRVVHKTRDKKATAPFDDDKVWGGDFTFDAANKDGVWWSSMDWAQVNGQDVNPLGEAGVHAGPGNGETLAWIQYDMTGFEGVDKLEVNLPIRGRESLEKKELAFTLDVKNLPGVSTIKAPQPVDFKDYTVKVSRFQISPIRVYLDLELVFHPGVPMERIKALMEPWVMNKVFGDETGTVTLRGGEFAGFGFTDNVETKVVEGKDWVEDSVIDPTKPVTLSVMSEYLTLDKYPDTFMVKGGEDKVLIPNIKAE